MFFDLLCCEGNTGTRVLVPGVNSFGRVVVPLTGNLAGVKLRYISGRLVSARERGRFGYHSGLTIFVVRSNKSRMFPIVGSTLGVTGVTRSPDDNSWVYYSLSGKNVNSDEIILEGPVQWVMKGEVLRVYTGEALAAPSWVVDNDGSIRVEFSFVYGMWMAVFFGGVMAGILFFFCSYDDGGSQLESEFCSEFIARKFVSSFSFFVLF